MLTNIWNASNTAKKLIWQAQVQLDKIKAKGLHLQEEEAHTLREAEAAKKKDNLQNEERKKNHSKFLLIPNWPIPQCAPIIAAQSATCRMDKGKFIPLWYCINKGLKNALSTYNSTNNNALSLHSQLNGLTALIPTMATKESKGVVKDHLLDWEDFTLDD